MAGKNGSKNGKAPWNKGLKGSAVGAGGEGSPWKGNGGENSSNTGRRPGDKNRETVERGFGLREIRDRLAAREIEQALTLDSIFDRLRVQAVQGDIKAAGLYLAYRLGRPKETVEVEGSGGLVAPGGFRCFLSDGRSVPSAALPVPDPVTPSA